jgi:hypothetical protein
MARLRESQLKTIDPLNNPNMVQHTRANALELVLEPLTRLMRAQLTTSKRFGRASIGRQLGSNADSLLRCGKGFIGPSKEVETPESLVLSLKHREKIRIFENRRQKFG